MLALAKPGEKRFAYGFWRYYEDEIDIAMRMLAIAREHGVDHIDTADVYGCEGGKGGFGGAESLLGAVRKRAPSLFDGAVIATKAGVELGTPYNNAPEYISTACDASLKRLGVDRVDLFYIHRHDLLSHPADVAAALEKLIASGKVGALGVSNYTPAQIDALSRYLTTPLRAVQVEFSAACLSPLFDGALDQAMRERMHVAAWSPLAGGRLGDLADEKLAALRTRLRDLAAQRDAPEAALALAFLCAHPAGVTPVLGTKQPERLRACLEAARIHLTKQEWYSVLEASLGHRMP